VENGILIFFHFENAERRLQMKELRQSATGRSLRRLWGRSLQNFHKHRLISQANQQRKAFSAFFCLQGWFVYVQVGREGGALRVSRALEYASRQGAQASFGVVLAEYDTAWSTQEH
jgi:hypothetical protein